MLEVRSLGKDRGRGLVATAPIPAHSILAIVLPDISVLYSAFAGSRCACCYAAKPPSEDAQGGGWFVCPTCDQFILCPECWAMLPANEATPKPKEDWIRSLSKPAGELYDAKRRWVRVSMAAHPLSCAWYNELPAAVRAPGQDTDLLRFCLSYGARVGQVGDTALATSIAVLDPNTETQSASTAQFCNSFAHKIVRTFSSASSHAAAVRSDAAEKGAEGSTLASTTSSTPSSSSRYAVEAGHLRDVLLRVQCNSLGFPFTSEETVGWSLQETLCMVNHSCNPSLSIICAEDSTEREGILTYMMGNEKAREIQSSADPSEEGIVEKLHPLLRGCMALKALRNIAMGEELTLSYLDLEQLGDSVEERSRELSERYRFLCVCSRCQQQRKTS
ncbi:unnamed protein product [Phytomonas sp. EM1]|nr:unnamed protein product [Phytomonas sp. EM1]|eukprot:CCW60234.1 unnamed protein product [Phytomonas sp. isolate EM1]